MIQRAQALGANAIVGIELQAFCCGNQFQYC